MVSAYSCMNLKQQLINQTQIGQCTAETNTTVSPVSHLMNEAAVKYDVLFFHHLMVKLLNTGGKYQLTSNTA